MDTQSQYPTLTLSEGADPELFSLPYSDTSHCIRQYIPCSQDKIHIYPDFGVPTQQPFTIDTQTELGHGGSYNSPYYVSPSSSGLSILDNPDGELDFTGSFEDFPMPTNMGDDPTLLTSFQYHVLNSTGTSISEPFWVSPSILNSVVVNPAVGIPELDPHPAHLENNQVSHPPRQVAKPMKITKQKNAQNTKMKHTRPCDLKKEMRKVEKPEKCVKCGKGFAWLRDLKRHYETHHKEFAAGIGLPVARIPCPFPSCVKANKTFARADHLTRHQRRKHGD